MTKYFKREKIKGYWYYVDTPVNAVEISDNTTNGDVIKALFPKMGYALLCHIQNNMGSDWWNSPYKRGETE